MSLRILSATLAVVLSAAAVAAQALEQTPLADAVASSITSYSHFTIFDDVSVLADDGTVTLRGKVTMPFKRDDIGRRVAAIDGVRAVRNEIEVLPVSAGDENLRRRIARAIYGNPAFWRYAALPNPPIHIIVERGRVTLTGVVPSDVDRALARSLATGQGELSVTCALRTDLEARGH
ncbi:MAG TPA: BON domain-containing protein [Vicinamibacterales bacterium]|nr:BON domain-containing protein [Vicinamibacterales bacterium]